MTTLVDRMPLADIETQARSWDPVRFVLTVLMAPLFIAGWLAGKFVTVVLRHVLRALWLAGSWAVAAVLVGYRAGRDGGTASGLT